jgi:hypothetical protein
MSRFVLIIPLGVAVGLTGCGACRTSNFVAQAPYSCNRCIDTVQPPRHGAVPGPPGSRSFAAVPAPSPGKPLPPAPAPTPGPAVEGGSATFVPPSGEAPPPPPDVLSRADDLPKSSAPSADPSSPDVRLGPPAPIRRESASIPPDATMEPPLANVPGDPRRDGGAADNKDLPQAIDLPGFAIAAPGVASGLKPFPDGIAWLAEKGYKTVLHLRAPGEDTAATRRMFEGKGMRYVSLVGSPARLSKQLYDSFVRLVKAAENHPLFVYDKDGSVAGGLWYLYYRVERNEPDEKARAEAQRLGLRFDDDPEHQAMVLAAQKLLSELKR